MRLRTIGLISTLALGLLAAPLPTEAQQAGKVYRIGYLSYYSEERDKLLAAFKQGLKELGYVEGKNIIIEERDDRGPALCSLCVSGLISFFGKP